MKNKIIISVLLLIVTFSNNVFASVQLCNRSDVTILVAIGLEGVKGNVESQGWWKIYPGFCGEPVSTNTHKGAYFIHAKTHPILAEENDKFIWGEEKTMCVLEGDFEIKNVEKCPSKSFLVGFNEFQGSWKNKNIINILNPKGSSGEAAENRVAGVQKMLRTLGYPIKNVNGAMDEKTYKVLEEISAKYSVDKTSFQALFSKLEELILESKRQ